MEVSASSTSVSENVNPTLHMGLVQDTTLPSVTSAKEALLMSSDPGDQVNLHTEKVILEGDLSTI